MISVCMATYNGSKYIRQQVESILIQLSFEDEVIISDDGSLDDWTLTIVLYIGTYMGANHISIWKHGITDTVTKEKVLTIGIPLPCSKTIRWGVKKKGRFTGKIPDENYRRNNRLLPVNFAKYDNMGTYIEDNIRIALSNLFEVGFTLKGYKVKKR